MRGAARSLQPYLVNVPPRAITALGSRLEPIKKVARTLKKHLEGLPNYFEHRITNAASESINSRIQALKANARGFRDFNNYRTRILLFLGKLHMAPAI